MLKGAFKNGWSLYKKDFWGLVTVSIIRFILPLAAAIAFIAAFVPASLAGVLPSSDPSLLPDSYLGFMGAYLLIVVVAAALSLPFFLYLNMSAAVLSHRNRLDTKSAFSLIKGVYPKMLLDTVIYFGIIAFLALESMFLYLLHQYIGMLALIVSAYILVRISFWDVLALLGEQHPIRSSWGLTKGIELEALAFFLTFSAVKMAFPALLLPLLAILLPFEATSKLSFVIEAKRKHNKSA